ncbi:hypothetical protein CRUP_032821 [Coryphaenoides rupestris]|nr:hypothetical protein CRUP_032821 [Coryphaenoides rupestris]
MDSDGKVEEDLVLERLVAARGRKDIDKVAWDESQVLQVSVKDYLGQMEDRMDSDGKVEEDLVLERLVAVVARGRKDICKGLGFGLLEIQDL